MREHNREDGVGHACRARMETERESATDLMARESWWKAWATAISLAFTRDRTEAGGSWAMMPLMCWGVGVEWPVGIGRDHVCAGGQGDHHSRARTKAFGLTRRRGVGPIVLNTSDIYIYIYIYI